MKTKRQIIWIDDEPNRRRTADLLNESSTIPVDFRSMKNKDLAREVEKILKGPRPSLVVVDHILDQTATSSALLRRGSTIAEAIKERWPTCPVIGVTGVDRLDRIDVRTQQTYDDLFESVNFGQYYERIDSIARDFAKIARRKPKALSDVVDLLQPPGEEVPRLEAALPQDLNKRRDGSVGSRLYRWVSRVLRGRPGFLYDELWSATFLGLNETGLEKVERLFKAALYRGVFAATQEPRWWKLKLSDILYARCPPDSGELSWHVGRRLSGIRSEHFSKCYVCKQDYPDTVAFLDTASDERRAMHASCTILDSRFKRELYFEDLRVMQGE
jgi:CheY-like chemotaxis protein